jgi:hypothetical protein
MQPKITKQEIFKAKEKERETQKEKWQKEN